MCYLRHVLSSPVSLPRRLQHRCKVEYEVASHLKNNLVQICVQIGKIQIPCLSTLKQKKKQEKQENGLGIGEVHFTMFFESLEQFQNLEFVSESLKFVLSDLQPY